MDCPRKASPLRWPAALAAMVLGGCSLFARDGRLYVGWAAADITPGRPVALVGQLHKRISEAVQDPLTATVLALETRGAGGSKEQAVMVSCDLLFIRAQTQAKIRGKIATELPDLDAAKLFLNATHSHTAPGLLDDEFKGLYDLSGDPGVMRPSEFEAVFVDRVSEAVVRAWRARQPGGFSWGLGHAVLGHNRRTVKLDGTARMYGVGEPDFSHYEGPNDDRVGMLFFWDERRNLTGLVVNSVATAQVTDGTNFVSADFYHEAREAIRKRYGRGLFIVFQVGAAGDITPVNHEYAYRRAEEAMLKKKGLTARQELAERLVRAVAEVLPYVKDDITDTPVFKHAAARIELPVKDPPAPPFYLTDDVRPAEFHVLRLGETALATNPFELFLDYGLLIKARSPAVMTLVVELAGQHSGYLPTARAEKGGGYSADAYLVGPDGGRRLVDETVRILKAMWDDEVQAIQ